MTSDKLSGITVIFDYNGVLADDIKEEIDRFIPKFLRKYGNLYGAAYSVLNVIGEVTFIGRKVIEEKPITKRNINSKSLRQSNSR